MRLFIAILFKPDMIEHLKEIKETLKKYPVKGVYTRDDMLHLTLHYIGQSDQEQMEEIVEKIGDISIAPFEVYSGNLDLFKKQKTKKLIYLDVNNHHALNDCHRIVIESLKLAGFDIKPYVYHPHITLARKAEVDLEDVKEIKVKPHRIVVDSIDLMESKREDDQLVYQSLYQKKFT